MRYGQTYSSGYGDPANVIAWLDIRTSPRNPRMLRVEFAPAPDFGDAFFSVYRNTQLMGRFYVEEGATKQLEIAKAARVDTNSVLVLRDGQLNDTTFMNIDCVRSFESGNDQPIIRWPWNYHVAGPDDQKTSNWSLAGLQYSDTVRSLVYPNQSDVSFDLDVTGGNVAVTVYNGENTLLSGEGAFPGTIALAGSNGQTGSVDVAAGAVDLTGGKVRLIWPDSMTLYRTNSGGTILSTLGTKLFNRQNKATFRETNNLTNGTYYYKGRFASAADDTNMSGYTSVASIVISNPPEPVTNLAVAASGTAADTDLTFTNSVTAGATYRLYLQRIGDDKIDIYVVRATALAGAGTIQMPVIAGYPGTVRALVKAVSGGLEDDYLTTVDIEYDAAGNVVYGTPNIPQIDIVNVDYSNGDLSIPVVYNPTEEAAVAVDINLYYRTDPAGSWTLFGTQTLGAEDNGVKRATFAFSGVGADMYYFAATAVAATGAESDKSASTTGFECGSFTVTAPTLVIDLGRE